MEIVKETLWSRIREQNSVYKEFLEIVGNGSLTDSVQEETIAVSAKILISVGKVHHQIRLRLFFMQQNESKASKTRSSRGKNRSGGMCRLPCKDCLKGTCNNSFCEKWHPLGCLFYKNKSGCRFGEKCSFAHRQVDEQPTERSKKNDDNSALAILKKGDWHESVRELVINYVKGHERSGRPDVKRDYELKQGSIERRSSNARQLGCVFQDMKPPKSNRMNEDLLPTEITIDQGNLMRGVIKSWDETHQNVSYLMHGKWAVHIRT